MNLVIDNALVLRDPEHGEPEPGCVHVMDGLVQYAGPSRSPEFEPERVIDAQGNLVMPGFYNLHTHVVMNVLRGYADDMPLQAWLFERIFPAEDRITDDMAYWATLAALCELARAGVVCINDMYDHCDAIARAVHESGMRAVLSRGVVTRGSASWRDKIAEAEELYRNWNGVGRIRVWFAPHGQYTNTVQSIREIGALARKYGTGVHTHVSETRSEHEDCIRETEMTPVELFAKEGLMDGPFVGAHCVWVSGHDLDIMAEKGAACASCARSNMKLGSGIAPISEMMTRGIPVGLGTDGAASNNRLSVMSEMEATSYAQKARALDPTVCSASQMLEAACKTGPRVLGEKGGTLTEGANADLIMLSTDGWRWNPGYNVRSSLVYAAQDCSVAMTIVGGDILFEDGHCTFADEEEVKARLKEYAKRIQANT